MFLARKPDESAIATFVARARELPFAPGAEGLLEAKSARGFAEDEVRIVLGRGASCFLRARHALREWRQYDMTWVEVHPRDTAIERGETLAVLASHLGFWSIHGCRIVRVMGDAHRFAFVYATLTEHAEIGEELFEVTHDPASDLVHYRVLAL